MPGMQVHCVGTCENSPTTNFRSKYNPHYTEHKMYILHSREEIHTPSDSQECGASDRTHADNVGIYILCKYAG